jgi:hypothetical protein
LAWPPAGSAGVRHVQQFRLETYVACVHGDIGHTVADWIRDVMKFRHAVLVDGISEDDPANSGMLDEWEIERIAELEPEEAQAAQGQPGEATDRLSEPRGGAIRSDPPRTKSESGSGWVLQHALIPG